MPDHIFEQEQSKLRGMNEHTVTVQAAESGNIPQKVVEVANLGTCQGKENVLRYYYFQSAFVFYINFVSDSRDKR